MMQDKGGKLMLATDGWKRKYAERGANCMNACLLHPDGGGSTFMEVR